MNRVHQWMLIVSTLALSWFAMMAVHETGHVLGALFTGGTVTKVVLHPLTISRTDVAPNPQPLLVVWAGPLFGVIVPLLSWVASQMGRVPFWYLLRFFAGFCLIANGAYLGVGSFDGVGDAGDLLRHGAPVWQLCVFGLMCVPTGLWLWHGLGAHFGLGDAEGKVSIPTAYVMLALLMVTVTVMTLFGGD
jgi:hypothetical protein